ncbi:MAG: hypothetical protein J6A08_06060 [Lachnospiraceae bacterium]|nr:hypothetical protein [Lachnospiraceae bacterium]
MSRIRTMLHAKRSITEEHIRKLEQAGRAGERYTATMPDVPFLVLGLICDAGWLIQVIARYAAGFTAAAPLMWVIAGGAINFLAGIPIFLSFKKGIRYGIR